MTAKITLTWDNGSSEHVDQIVYRSVETFTVDNLPPILARVGRNAREYVDTDIMTGNVYFYAVASENTIGEILLSSVISVTAESSTGDPHWDNVVSLLQFYKGYPFDEKGHLWLFSNSDGFEYVDGMFGTALKNTNINNRRLFSDLSGYQIVNSDIWTMDIQFSYLNADNVNVNGLVFIGNPDSDDNRYMQHISISNRAWWNSRDKTSLDIGNHGDGNMRLLSIVRDGSRQLGFVDGVKVFDTSILFPTGASPIFSLFTRRGGSNLNNSMIGVIEQFRMTQGVARYTENFTPPTEPFPNF